MTDLNERALEAAALALISPVTSRNLQMDMRSAARRCVQSYLSALVQDEATVERVARAMCVANGTNPDWPVSNENHPRWTIWEPEARAALSALANKDTQP